MIFQKVCYTFQFKLTERYHKNLNFVLHLIEIQEMRKFALFVLTSLFLTQLCSAEIKYKITVSQDGTGDYTTIQDAVDACKSFPPKRITIYVKNGIYKEKVKIPAWNPKISLIGESKEKTIITNDDYFKKIDRGRNSTFFTYTLKVDADDFYAENITIENTAGKIGQAVALHVEGNRCKFENCIIKGDQDTLYAAGTNSLQYYVNCYIEGTTDFIFGAATAFFEACTIHNKTNSYITAASTPEGRAFGYVFYQCTLTASDNVNAAYLGRPWRPFAKVAFIECKMGAHITEAGWKNWSGTDSDKTVHYAEYGNSGPGAKNDNRVEWSHQLTKEEAAKYSLTNVLSPLVNESNFDWILE